MATEKTDFLRFNAYSIKELITRKLSQDSKFTDQIYEGSNLAVIIDIFSYMYQCLIYQLNNAASESMFADTQLYENMVRLIKFLGYNPRGCSPSWINIGITRETTDWKILPYTTFQTNNTDSQGRSICFSTGCGIDDDKATDGTNFQIRMYNGQWKAYNTIFTASGVPNETFVLNGLKSDSDTNQFVANDFIRIIVYDQETQTYDDEWTIDTDGIFMSTTRKSVTGSLEDKYMAIYNNESKKYSVSLNQYKAYEIRFGDGITGRTLTKNSRVYILYLDTNGYDGNIDISDYDITNLKLKIPQDIKILPPGLLQTIYGNEDIENYDNGEYQMFFSMQDGKNTSKFQSEENVQSIRENAPNWFKTGNRLITKWDYEYFIKNRLQFVTSGKSASGGQSEDEDGVEIPDLGRIIDVKCMNNIQYVSTFYKWLYLQGLKNSSNDGQYYLRQDANNIFSRCNYFKLDPSDTNNIYLWIKGEKDYSVQSVTQLNKQIENAVNGIKSMTTEINVVKPIKVFFDVCAANDDYVKQHYMSLSPFDGNNDSYIEITLNDDVSFVGNMIQQRVHDIIMEEFSQDKITLGYKIDNSSILNKIYEINGIKRVRTIWKNPDDQSETIVIDGISFASWTDTTILTEYEDLQVGNNSRHMEEFQYPKFNGEDNLYSRIKVIRKQITTVNSIKF